MITSDDLIDQLEGLETWKNVAKGTFVVQRHGARPGTTSDELVKGGHAFHILPEERRLNQRKVTASSRDPFTNGNFMPIHLIETEKDTQKLLAEGRGVTEDDLIVVFELDGAAFDARIDAFTERVTLLRLLDIAETLDVRASQKAKVESRISDLRPAPASANPSRGEPKPGDPGTK